MKKRTISLMGSTGSIGRQSLDVIAACGMDVAALTANNNVELMEQQVRQFKPTLAVMMDEKAAADLKLRLADTGVRVASGMDGLLEAAQIESADTVITAVMGMVGLRPTLAAIRQGKRIALANKETLVCGGQIVMAEAKKYNAEIAPVDSEHSALFQCLQGNRDRGEVKRLILTASGGPFFGYTKEQLEQVTLAQALKHPNWSMGAKITIDSATLMNKGLEFIEAMHLYAMPPEKISIVVHRESIIHSLVEYCDNAILAQMGTADMRLPIQYALSWPQRIPGPAAELDMLSCPNLTFAKPDPETFACLGLALRTAKLGGNAGAVLNGANEAAVGLFLKEKIRFTDIPRLVERAMEEIPVQPVAALEDVLEADARARQVVMSNVK